MSATMEVMSPNGHEVMTESIFSKLKTYLDSNPYGYLTNHQDISGKVNKSGDTISGDLTFKNGTSNDTPDIIFKYGNGNEKMRIWSDNEPTTAVGPNYRIYKSDGTQLYSGKLATLADLVNTTYDFKSSDSSITFQGSAVGSVVNIDAKVNSSKYLPLSGGTMTGALNTANNTWNKIGDDVQIGDVNAAGALGIKGLNGTTNLRFYKYNDSAVGTLSYDGNWKFSNYVYASYFNASCGAETPTTSSYLIYANSDGFFRKTTLANVKTILGLGSRAYDSTSYYPLSGGDLNGYIGLKATNLNKDASNIQTWSNKEINWFDTNRKRLGGLNVRQYSGSTRYFGFEWWCEDGNGKWNSLRLINYVSESKYAVTSPINFRNAIGAAASSSRLYKTNIQDMDENEAKKILDIGVKSFDYKEGFVHECDKKDKYYGIIAEEAIEKLPYVVNVPKDYDETKFNEKEGMLQKILTVDYANFVPYLIKMVQIQQREIDILKTKLSR